jgi:hypothetical protein
MDSLEPSNEQVNFIPPNYMLAYASLARRVAAADALLRSGDIGPGRWGSVSVEIEEAMNVIKQVETTQLVIDASHSTYHAERLPHKT